jgi:predicted ribosomally synthesized peptide with nif11-like leader
MSMESAKLFIERMSTDKELAKIIIACNDYETALPLITKEGFDFTQEEIKLCQSAEFSDKKLSDEELEAISGGMGIPNMW